MAKPDWIQLELERNFANAKRVGMRVARTEPRAESAQYLARAQELRIQLTNGIGLSVPVALMPELHHMTAAKRRAIEVLPGGDGLYWKHDNIAVSVPGLIASLMDTRLWMSALGRRGGSRTSSVKSEAARANGRRGGRPRMSSGSSAAHARTGD